MIPRRIRILKRYDCSGDSVDLQNFIGYNRVAVDSFQ